MIAPSLLDRPEYVHAAINHFPLVGLSVAMLALLAALATRNRAATLIGLALVGLLSLSVWPVYHFGEEGYDRVLSMSDETGAAYLQLHQKLAERWVFLYFLTAGAAALGFGLSWKWPRSLPYSSILALALAAASLATGFIIARAGGEIRHREFRFGSPPPRHDQSLLWPSSLPELVPPTTDRFSMLDSQPVYGKSRSREKRLLSCA